MRACVTPLCSVCAPVFPLCLLYARLLHWRVLYARLQRCTFTCPVLLQYADPVSDLLDKWDVFRCRLFRESCVFHRGNYVKVSLVQLDILILVYILC